MDISCPPNTLQIFSECFTLLDNFKLLSETAPWLHLLRCCTFDSLPPTTGGQCHTHTKYNQGVEKDHTDLFLGGCCGPYRNSNRGDASDKGRVHVKRLVLCKVGAFRGVDNCRARKCGNARPKGG